MKLPSMRSLVVAALLGVTAGLDARQSTTFARSWLRLHSAPNGDELAELKTENPDAYALVKALLTKRSLGLLDPKHPSASFSAPPPVDNSPHGAEAFAGLVTPEELAAHGHGEPMNAESPAALYPDAPVHTVHHDPWKWKPADSAVSDDEMVKSVLGAVSNLMGAKKADVSPAQDASPLSADAAMLAPDTSTVPPKVPTTTAAPQGNSYLRDLNLDSVTASPIAAVAAPHKKSFLYGLNSHSSAPAAAADSAAVAPVAAPETTNYLTSFSWGDDAKPGPQRQQVGKQTATHKPKTSLSSWLFSSKEEAAPAEAVAPRKAPAQPAAEVNPYLAALQ